MHEERLNSEVIKCRAEEYGGELSVPYRFKVKVKGCSVKQLNLLNKLLAHYGEGVDSLLEYIKGDTDVLECYAISGEYDYLLKICARDVESLEEKLLSLKRLKGVTKSHTMLSLMEHKFTSAVLPEEDE